MDKLLATSIRAIQGHSGGALVDPTLQDNVLLPNDCIEHINHVGLHSIIQSGLIPGSKSLRKDRHAVFFTAVNPMRVDQHKEVEYDLTNSRITVYKNHWKVHQNTVFGCNLKLARRKGLNLLLTQDRNKHQCRRLLLQRLRYHITSVIGSTSNQVSRTKAVSKCQKKR